MPIFSTFDPRYLILQTLRELEIPIAAFSALQHESQVSRWKIERALRGENDFAKWEAEHLVCLANECRDLVESFPCSLDWRDTTRIGAIMKQRREQKIAERFQKLEKQNDETKTNVIDCRQF